MSSRGVVGTGTGIGWKQLTVRWLVALTAALEAVAVALLDVVALAEERREGQPLGRFVFFFAFMLIICTCPSMGITCRCHKSDTCVRCRSSFITVAC